MNLTAFSEQGLCLLSKTAPLGATNKLLERERPTTEAIMVKIQHLIATNISLGRRKKPPEEISVSENPKENASGLRSSAVDDAGSDNDTNETTSNASAMKAVEKTIDTRRNLISKFKDKKNSKLT